MDLERSMVLEQIFHRTTFTVFCFRFNQSVKKAQTKQNKTQTQRNNNKNPPPQKPTNKTPLTQILDLPLLFLKQVCRIHP